MNVQESVLGMSREGAGLDYRYLGLIAAVLVALGAVWVYANRRLSNFNGETRESKQEVQENLNKGIYREGTAPLVMTVSNYIGEQILVNFTEDEREVIDRYEEQRQECMDSTKPSFIDFSNFADTIEYDQKIANLIAAHASIERHNQNYIQMRRNLKMLSIVCWFPIFLVACSLLLHFSGFILFRDSAHFSYLVQTTFIIGILLSVPTVVFYLKYMRCVNRLDKIGVSDE